MDCKYNVFLSEEAERNLDHIVEYIALKLFNDIAAANVLKDALKTRDKLKTSAEIYKLCDDKILASKGYRKIVFEKHQYVMLYQIKGNNVFVNGIFHTLENYAIKL